MSNKAKTHVRTCPKLRRFHIGLWAGTLLMVISMPWPYGLATTLLAVCLHFAALDGPLAEDAAARSRSEKLNGG